jgi:hypothetical protein
MKEKLNLRTVFVLRHISYTFIPKQQLYYSGIPPFDHRLNAGCEHHDYVGP